MSSSAQSICHHQKQFDKEVDDAVTKVDNLLVALQNYFKEVKTKRQLSMEDPAGFQHDSEL
jgi:hypothetical protein